MINIPEFIVEPTDPREDPALRGFFAYALNDPNAERTVLPVARYALARASLSNPQIIGVIAINAFANIEVLLVAPDRRREGVARALMQWAADTARSQHALAIRCDLNASLWREASAPARSAMESCLQALDFSVEASDMWARMLALATPVARIVDQQALTQAIPQPQAIGGKTSAEARAASLQVITAAQRELAIYTRDLDPLVLNTQAVLDALRVIALKPGARLRFLVHQTERALRDGHRLLELSRRLPSNFEFRCAQSEDLAFAGAFIVNDQWGFLSRAFADRFECEGELYDIAQSSRLRRYFDEVWERSRQATEWRRLSL